MANNGRTCEARALIGSGSQIKLLTQRMVNKSALKTINFKVTIEEIAQRVGT